MIYRLMEAAYAIALVALVYLALQIAWDSLAEDEEEE